MKKRIGRHVAIWSTVAIVSSFAVLITPRSASAAAAPNWTSLQSAAAKAIATQDSGGPVHVTNVVPSKSIAPLTINGKSVSVAEATFLATDSSGTYETTITWLGNEQELVGLVPMSGGTQTTQLELVPGSSQIAGVFHSNMSYESTETNPTSVQPLIASYNFYVGNCQAYIISPGVEGSIYGPLIWGDGGFAYPACPQPSASMLLELNYWNGARSVSLGDVVGASGNPSASPGVSTTAFYPCVTGGPDYFQTAGYYATSQPANTTAYSYWEYLGCAV